MAIKPVVSKITDADCGKGGTLDPRKKTAKPMAGGKNTAPNMRGPSKGRK